MVVRASVTLPKTIPENISTVPESRILNPVVQSKSPCATNLIWSKPFGAPVMLNDRPLPDTDISACIAITLTRSNAAITLIVTGGLASPV